MARETPKTAERTGDAGATRFMLIVYRPDGVDSTQERSPSMQLVLKCTDAAALLDAWANQICEDLGRGREFEEREYLLLIDGLDEDDWQEAGRVGTLHSSIKRAAEEMGQDRYITQQEAKVAAAAQKEAAKAKEQEARERAEYERLCAKFGVPPVQRVLQETLAKGQRAYQALKEDQRLAAAQAEAGKAQ